jgi:[ribosomal protein S5]-alanine N-acetyltransferase
VNATKLRLRPWRQEDLHSLLRHADDTAVAARMTDSFPHPFTIAAGEAFLQRVMADEPARVLAIEVDGEAVGSIGIFPQQDIYRRNAELGYWLARSHWGRGLMSQALMEMSHYAFANFPELHRLFARPFGSNIASQRVLEKCGYQLEAVFRETLIKNGSLEDEHVYALRRDR